MPMTQNQEDALSAMTLIVNMHLQEIHTTLNNLRNLQTFHEHIASSAECAAILAAAKARVSEQAQAIVDALA